MYKNVKLLHMWLKHCVKSSKRERPFYGLIMSNLGEDMRHKNKIRNCWLESSNQELPSYVQSKPES